MAGSQEIQDKPEASAEQPESTRLASADLGQNPVDIAPAPDTANLHPLTVDSINPSDAAMKFKAPDFKGPTDVAAAPAVAPEKSQEATDVSNLFAAIAKGDKAQIVALQSKLLGSNNLYEGSYMGQNFRLSREKYNEKTHKVYSEAEYLYVGKNLVTRTNVRRDDAKREVQTSGSIVSVARNQYAPGSDTSVAAGNVADGKFLNADDQRNDKGAFVQSLLPKGQEVVKQLVAKAQTANGADVRLGKGANAFEAKVNLAGDGTVSSVVGKTPLEPAKPVTEVKPEVTQPQLQPTQLETFLRENKDNKARELVGAISSGDAKMQAQAIRQLVAGGVESLSFTRPGVGERPQQLSFKAAENGRIAIRLDGQVIGRVMPNGNLHPNMLTQNLKNLGLDSNGPISIGMQGREQKIELAKNPAVASERITPSEVVATPNFKPDSTVRYTPEQLKQRDEIEKTLNAQGYSRVDQTFKPEDVIASIRPDGAKAFATIKGVDSAGNLMVEDGVSKLTVTAADWSSKINPERRNLTLMMRKMPAARTELPAIQNDIALRTAPHMTGAKLASQATSVRDTDQVGALKKILAPFDVHLGDAKNSTQIQEQLNASNRFSLVLQPILLTDSNQAVAPEPTLPGDVHILTPKNQVTNGDILDWQKRNSPGMVLGITNEKGEMVNVSNGQRLDPTQFFVSSYRATASAEFAPPLEASVVYGRLFPKSENANVEALSSQPKAIQDVENALRKADSRFISAGQINTSELAGRIASMEVGTTLVMSGAEPNDKRVAVVGEIQANINSSEKVKVLYSTDGSGSWSRIDDANWVQRAEFKSAEIFKPKEAVNLSAPSESNSEFDRRLEELTDKAFYSRQLIGDPRAKEKFYSAIKSGALPIDALKRYISEVGDVHSSYLVKREISDMKDKTSGFGGLGIEFSSEKNQIKVNDVFKGSAADKAVLAGTNQPFTLRTGDIIKTVNGQSLEGKTTEEATNLLRGPINSKVEIEIQRPKDGSPGQFENFKVSMVRQLVVPPSVQTEMDNTGIVHIRMNRGFNEQTANQFKSEIERIKAEKGDQIKGFVLDLRNNGGGLLDSSLSIISAFAPMNSPMLVVRERSGGTNDKPEYKSYDYRLTEKGIAKVPVGYKGEITNSMMTKIPTIPRTLIDKPVSVLVNERSASASEVVASALQDYGIAAFGTNTFGKGSVQTLYESPRIRITSAQYLSPLSHKWMGNWPNPRANRDPQNPDSNAQGPRGLQPDILVRARTADFKIGSAEDNQISEVRQLMLRNMLAR